jgi:serine/threonine protein kinase
VLGRLQHPGIAHVLSFHRGDRRVPAHLVMELIEGPPITEYVTARALDYSARIELMIAVCHAVHHAHERGIVHRDLKPANVLVTNGGQPKVLDFGVARATGLDVTSTIQTVHGQLLGTLAYMSPERLRGRSPDVDGRSDVYALGVMFYRLMAGRLPFDLTGLPLVDAAHCILFADIMPLGSIDPALQGSIEQVARRAMAADPDIRYRTAASMAADLQACLEGRPLATAAVERSARARVLVAESRARRVLAIGLTSGAVMVLDAVSGTTLARIDGDGTPVERLTFDDDGALTIARSNGQSERVEIAPAA